MKVIVNTKELQSAVKKLSLTAYKKAALPMCRDIHMEALRDKNVAVLGVTDAQLVRFIPVRAEVLEDGQVALDCDKLGKILASAKKQVVTIETLENEDVQVESGVRVTMAPREWQNLGDILAIPENAKRVAGVHFPAGVLQDAIARVEWSAATKQEIKPNMESVCIDLMGEKATIVCTNGCTLAWQETEARFTAEGNSAEKMPIFPEQVLAAIKSMEGAVDMYIHLDHVVLKTGAEDYIRFKHLDASYPMWRRVVPQELKYKLALEDNLRKGLKDYRALLKSLEAPDEKIVLTFTDEATKFGYHTNDIHVEDEVPLQAGFSGIESGFQIRLDMARLMPLLGSHKEMPVCGVNDAENPIQFDYPNGYHALLMPCRSGK